jgi:uncharacterized protein
MKLLVPLIIGLFVLVAVSGCTATESSISKPAYKISEDGLLSLSLPNTTVSTQVISEKDGITTEKITMHTFEGDVNAILANPPDPKAAIVYAPGAGEPASSQIPRAEEYANHSIAFLVIDVRGNGGETPGHPLDFDSDLSAYIEGKWPQLYLIVSDMIAGQEFITGRFGDIPVWAAGSSNGGRYAAIATAADQEFTGYIGVSTAGFGMRNLSLQEPARAFLLSVEPDIAITTLAPRPVYIFHALKDPIIPYSSGEDYAKRAGKDAVFIPFNGTHGINKEVDNRIFDLVF